MFSQQVKMSMAYNPQPNKESMRLCISYIDKLAKSIKHQFTSGQLDLYVYEQQINVLTCLRLHFELYQETVILVPGGVFINEHA